VLSRGAVVLAVDALALAREMPSLFPNPFNKENDSFAVRLLPLRARALPHARRAITRTVEHPDRARFLAAFNVLTPFDSS
jgi:hypothetical protein